MNNRDVAKLMALIVMKDELQGQYDHLAGHEQNCNRFVKRYVDLVNSLHGPFNAYDDDLRPLPVKEK